MRVFWAMEAEVKFTHRALLPPTAEAQNRNTHTFTHVRVCKKTKEKKKEAGNLTRNIFKQLISLL